MALNWSQLKDVQRDREAMNLTTSYIFFPNVDDLFPNFYIKQLKGEHNNKSAGSCQENNKKKTLKIKMCHK